MTSAIAHTNIALIKYWGKSNFDKNLPAVGSLSLTLDGFYTQTTLSKSLLGYDQLSINKRLTEGIAFERVTRFLNRVRTIAKSNVFVRVDSENHVPMKSGLASSASAFASLALACNQYFGLDLNQTELSALAGFGSGSAARSIFGGLSAITLKNKNYLGAATQVCCSDSLDLRMIFVICSDKQKSISSSDGMRFCQETSPYFEAWKTSHASDLNQAVAALEEGDFALLGRAMEHSTLKMHALTMSSSPGFFYFNTATIGVIEYVKALRQENLQAYFTMDAGPHVKILCLSADENILMSKLSRRFPELKIMSCAPGRAAFISCQ